MDGGSQDAIGEVEDTQHGGSGEATEDQSGRDHLHREDDHQRDGRDHLHHANDHGNDNSLSTDDVSPDAVASDERPTLRRSTRIRKPSRAWLEHLDCHAIHMIDGDLVASLATL
jgi:hypothetical protein